MVMELGELEERIYCSDIGTFDFKLLWHRKVLNNTKIWNSHIILFLEKESSCIEYHLMNTFVKFLVIEEERLDKLLKFSFLFFVILL